MRVAVCDDDGKMRSYYAELIKLVAEKKNIPVTVDKIEKGEQLLFAMSGRKVVYDIVFLDIFMPGTDGIDLGCQLKKAGFIGSIIYLTRSKEHMLSAFDLGATNYVLKSEDPDDGRFERVFVKAAQQVERRKRKYLLLNGITEHRNVAIETIRYFEVKKHICVVFYGRGDSFEFVSSLSKIEKTLAAFGFVRVHKSFLVNCTAVKSYTFKEIIMNDDVRIPLGRKRVPVFREAMEALSEIDTSKLV